MSKLLKLNQQVQTCRLCRLCRTRMNGVPGEGPDNATFMFIGEGPGFNEDREGRPFVGQAGQFLEELLSCAGLTREQVYITNVVKCRPPQNRDPLPDEIDACAPYLERQMSIIDPLVIVTLGRYSMYRFFPNDRITQAAGKARYAEGRMVVTMLHPAFALRNVESKESMREAFRKLPAIAEQARRDRESGANRPAAPQPMDEAVFAGAIEQHLNEIEQRLNEQATPQPVVVAEAPADPFAYTSAVRNARKPGRKKPAEQVVATVAPSTPEPEVVVAPEPVAAPEQPATVATLEPETVEVAAPPVEVATEQPAEVAPEQPAPEPVPEPVLTVEPEPIVQPEPVAEPPTAVANVEPVAEAPAQIDEIETVDAPQPVAASEAAPEEAQPAAPAKGRGKKAKNEKPEEPFQLSLFG